MRCRFVELKDDDVALDALDLLRSDANGATNHIVSTLALTSTRVHTVPVSTHVAPVNTALTGGQVAARIRATPASVMIGSS